MQDKYVYMQAIYVNMQLIYGNMQGKNERIILVILMVYKSDISLARYNNLCQHV